MNIRENKSALDIEGIKRSFELKNKHSPKQCRDRHTSSPGGSFRLRFFVRDIVRARVNELPHAIKARPPKVGRNPARNPS